MRILGLDYGSKTIGAALSDPLGLTAQPLETIRRSEENHLRRSLARLEAICREYEVDRLVVGLPLNMDDSEGERAAAARAFGEKLSRRTGLPLYFEDERLTTLEAEEVLAECGIARRDFKKYVDSVAASLILRSYMEKEERNG